MCSTSTSKAGSARAASYWRSSSSRAGISVSGTYRPPNTPKRSVVSTEGAISCARMYGVPECAHARVIFDPGCRLHTRGDVHNLGSQQANGFGDILGAQSPSQHELGTPTRTKTTELVRRIPPRQRDARPAELPRHLRVEQHGVRAVEQLRRARRQSPARDTQNGPHCSRETTAERVDVMRVAVAVELDDMQTELSRAVADDLVVLVGEHADATHRARQPSQHGGGSIDCHLPRSAGEDHADIRRTERHCLARIIGARHAAKLDVSRHEESAVLPLGLAPPASDLWRTRRSSQREWRPLQHARCA